MRIVCGRNLLPVYNKRELWRTLLILALFIIISLVTLYEHNQLYAALSYTIEYVQIYRFSCAYSHRYLRVITAQFTGNLLLLPLSFGKVRIANFSHLPAP